MKRSAVTLAVAVMLCAGLLKLAVELLAAGHGSDLFLQIALSPFCCVGGGHYLALTYWVIVLGMLVTEIRVQRKIVRAMLGIQAVSACGVVLWYLFGDEWASLRNVILKRWLEVLAFMVVYVTLLVWTWLRADGRQPHRESTAHEQAD